MVAPSSLHPGRVPPLEAAVELLDANTAIQTKKNWLDANTAIQTKKNLVGYQHSNTTTNVGHKSSLFPSFKCHAFFFPFVQKYNLQHHKNPCGVFHLAQGSTWQAGHLGHHLARNCILQSRCASAPQHRNLDSSLKMYISSVSPPQHSSGRLTNCTWEWHQSCAACCTNPRQPSNMHAPLVHSMACDTI